MDSFAGGSPVILRYVSPDPNLVFDRVQIGRVIEDVPDRTVLHIAADSEYLQPSQTRIAGALAGTAGDFVAKTWNNWSIVRVMYPQTPYSIWAMFSARTGEFARWYVNIEKPFRRTQHGLDTMDYELDVVVEADLSWKWKDEDHLARMVGEGLFTEQEAASFREYGLDAISRVENLSEPFNELWPMWRPPDEWGPLAMPADSTTWQKEAPDSDSA